MLLRPLPVTDAASLASVSTTDQRNPGNLPISHLNFKDLRAQNAAFTDMAAFTFAAVNYSAGKESEQIPAQIVTSNYFSLLGTAAGAGPRLPARRGDPATPVAVLSQGFWQRSLGSDPQIVGKTITLNRTPFTIIGVAPKNFSGTLLGGGPSVWLPMSMHLVAQPGFDWYDTRRGLFLFAFGRLKPGTTSNRRARTSARSLPTSNRRSPSTTRDAARPPCRCSTRGSIPTGRDPTSSCSSRRC